MSWNISYTQIRSLACICSANQGGLADLLIADTSGNISKAAVQDPMSLIPHLKAIAAKRNMPWDWPAGSPSFAFGPTQGPPRGEFAVTRDLIYLPWPLPLSDIHNHPEEDRPDSEPDDFKEKSRLLAERGFVFPDGPSPPATALRFIRDLDEAIDNTALVVRYRKANVPVKDWEDPLVKFLQAPGSSLRFAGAHHEYHAGTVIHLAPSPVPGTGWTIHFPLRYKDGSGQPREINWGESPVGSPSLPGSPDVDILNFTATCNAFWINPK
jgi:hypothetical protein